MPKEDADRTVRAEYRMCRVFNHAWDYTTVKRVDGELVQGLVCIRCSTERFIRMDPLSGETNGSRYAYADGYLFHGGGALTPQERAELRLTEVLGHLPRRRKR